MAKTQVFETYGNGLYDYNRKRNHDIEQCLLRYIFGPWSCVKCKYMNFWGKYECQNCSYKWETPNQRLVPDELEELQHCSDEYMLTFFENPFHVAGMDWACDVNIARAYNPDIRPHLGKR